MDGWEGVRPFSCMVYTQDGNGVEGGDSIGVVLVVSVYTFDGFHKQVRGREMVRGWRRQRWMD